MRNSQRKNLQNSAVKSRLRRTEKQFRATVAAGKKDEAAKLLSGVHSAFYKAVKVVAITASPTSSVPSLMPSFDFLPSTQISLTVVAEPKAASTSSGKIFLPPPSSLPAAGTASVLRMAIADPVLYV